MSTPESRVKAKIKDVLKASGAWYFMPSMLGYGRIGIPDFICCYKGRFFAIEAKGSPQSGLRARQVEEIKQIKAAGGEALVIHSIDEIDSIRLLLRGIDDAEARG